MYVIDTNLAFDVFNLLAFRGFSIDLRNTINEFDETCPAILALSQAEALNTNRCLPKPWKGQEHR